MAADVVFTADSPRYANSHSWNRIMGHALPNWISPPGASTRGYADVLEVDFIFLPDAKAGEVARWLSGLTERMLAEVR